MTTATSPQSPRKTRKTSRSMPAKVEPTPGPSDLHGTEPVATVTVVQASSMEPVSFRRAVQEKRPRHKMSEHQLQRLEELFQADTHPGREEKDALAKELDMTLKSVMIWFQNRRQDRRRKPATGAVMGKAPSANNTPDTTPSPAPPAGPRKRPSKPLPARAADKRTKLATSIAVSAIPLPSSAQAPPPKQRQMQTQTKALPDSTATSRSGTAAPTLTQPLPASTAKSHTGATNASPGQKKTRRPAGTRMKTSHPAAAPPPQGKSRTRRPVRVPEITVSSGGEESTLSTVHVENLLTHGESASISPLHLPHSSRASSVTVRNSSGDAFRHVLFKTSSPPSPQHSHSTVTTSTFASPPSTTGALPLSNSSNTPTSTLLSLRPNLEWACENSAARRKHGLFVYRDEDDSSGESTDFEDDLAAPDRHRKGKDVFRPSKRRRLHIPEEYHTICSPDLVFGATLLLGLKHSVDIL